MEHQQSPLSISPSLLDVSTLLRPFQSDPAFMSQLEQAGVLIVPTNVGGDRKIFAFPATTRDVYDYLRSSLKSQTSVEAAVRDEDYREYEFHSDQIIVPILWVSENLLLPLVVNLIATYVYNKLSNQGDLRGKRVKAEFLYKNPNGKQVSLKYDGPVETFERVTLQSLSEQGVPPYDEKGTGSENRDAV